MTLPSHVGIGPDPSAWGGLAEANLVKWGLEIWWWQSGGSVNYQHFATDKFLDPWGDSCAGSHGSVDQIWPTAWGLSTPDICDNFQLINMEVFFVDESFS